MEECLLFHSKDRGLALDGNHLFAGETVVFRVTISSIQNTERGRLKVVPLMII